MEWNGLGKQRKCSLVEDWPQQYSSRMVSWHGLPKDILCDNGSSLVGGRNELKELEALDEKKIQNSTVEE